MKKLFAGICLAVLAVSLCACKREGEGSESVSETDDFVCYSGSRMTATPEGYYVLNGDMYGYFLYYITPDFSKATIACDKLECVHNEKKHEELTDYLECNAYMPGANPQIEYYEGYLYAAVADYATQGVTRDVVYKISLDGTEKTLLYTAKQEIRGLSIYKDKIYIGEQSYTSSGVETTITTFPVDKPEKAEILYQTDDYGTGTMNRMKFYGDFCYFYLFEPGDINERTVYIQVNIKDGTAQEMYQPADVRLELGDYGTLLEVQKYISYDDETWESTYYHRKPGSEEVLPLTEKDFPSVKNGDKLQSIDKEYVYFMSINVGKNKLAPEEQRVWVYDYEGNVAAEIPAGEFGEYYFVLPGTDQYMFIQSMEKDFTYDYYYVDKGEFDGGVVEAHKIPMEW